MTLAEILRQRGFVYQFSSETLEEITDGPKRTVYLGIDPTADSIHAGNLAGYILLRHFADAGHKIVLLIGGGTGMIGDPKPDAERPLEAPETVAIRAAKIADQAKKLLGGADVEVVNNHDWLAELKLIDFLRDIGKRFTVNNLMKKDAIAKRLESEEGITCTEFAYPLLQAYDFWHLFTTKGVDVQVAGSDQWGNVTAGIDLIRRKEGKQAYALTMPLITDKATGKKFGKSEGNAVWLDPAMTSPFRFYQFWLGASDESVEGFLKIFTTLSLDRIANAVREQHANPGARAAQKLLAHEVTALVHAATTAAASAAASEALFGETSIDASIAVLLRAQAPTYAVRIGESIVDVLVAAGLASSKREARQFLADGAVTLGSEKADESRTLSAADFRHGVALLKRGKKNVRVLALE